jgi:hypothetical protein
MHQHSLNVFGIGKRNALLELIKLECLEVQVRLIGYDASNCCPARDAVTPEFFTVPLASSTTYLGTVTDLLAANHSIGHLSIIDPEILPLGQLEQQGTTSSQLLNAPYATALVCQDKLLFYQALKDSSIAVMPTSLEPIFDYPFITKDRLGSGASGFKVFGNAEDKPTPIDTVKTVYQPFCDGRHYCIDAYYSIYTDRLIDFCAKEVLSKSNGESYSLCSVSPDIFFDLLHGISEVLPMRGIVNLDIHEQNGKLIVLDLNCRIGGNYPASHSFGCNLIKPMLRELLTKSPAEPHFSPYVQNKVISKYFAFTQPYTL